MTILVEKYNGSILGNISLTASKSESNRVLLMSALSKSPFEIRNLSKAKDTNTMNRLLESLDRQIWDVQEAGTTMRFCTAYLAMRGNDHVITGTDRMKKRPIGLLVNALRALGSKIEYIGKDGFPPLKISRLKNQLTKEVNIPGNISSQFISAVLMISPLLPFGIKLNLKNDTFSRPYIEMTLGLMKHFGIEYNWEGQTISIERQDYVSNSYTIESDWSGASYWFTIASVADNVELILYGLRRTSHQGDRKIIEIMKEFGISSEYTENGLILKKLGKHSEKIIIDFKTCPDLAQGLMVAAALKGITLEMIGLETLRIKETDRLAAMTNELQKINANLYEKEGVWYLIPGKLDFSPPIINTYEDHRMAMAFAPLALISPFKVREPDVVRKSYPSFWDDLASVGIVSKKIHNDVR